MHLAETKVGIKGKGSLRDYFEVIKPRETGLLVFIGVVTAVVAIDGSMPIGRFLFTLFTLILASAGANGLTNYLDRDIDARMERTRRRALPSGKIFPPERALVFTSCLSAAGLIMAWYLHPVAFAADIVGTAAAVIYRKKVTCVFPQGMIASCAPVVMGWFAARSTLDWELLFLCVLIALWLPSHIWSVMIAHKEDYRNAGINYFPVNRSVKAVARILFIFCWLLYASSLGLYFGGHLGGLYLVAVNIAGIVIVYASWRLILTSASADAWKLYKLSAFPYLGLIFLVMGLDIWLRL